MFVRGSYFEIRLHLAFCSSTNVQLWGGGGSPFTYEESTNTCVDRAGTSVKLLGAIPEIFDEVGQWGNGARVAIASRTDEPSWAREILGKFQSVGGATLIERVDPDLVEMCVTVAMVVALNCPESRRLRIGHRLISFFFFCVFL